MNIPISYISIGAGVVVLLALIIGPIKGILKSFFGLIAFAGGVVATIYVTPYLNPYVEPYLQGLSFLQNFPNIAQNIGVFVSSLICFVVVWLILKIIFRFILKKLRQSKSINAVDRVLGLVYSLASGFVFILFMAYLINILNFVPAIQTHIIDNAINNSVDPVGKWLITNTIIDDLVAKIPSVQTIFDSIKNVIAGFSGMAS